MTLISRYIFREAFGATLLVTSVLVLILMSNQFAEILGDAAANQLPRDAVFAVLSLTFLRYLTLLAPIGLFLGIILALARLNRDSEMAALASCGVGPIELLKPTGLLTAMVAAGASWLALVETPRAMRQIEQIRFAAAERMELSAIEAGTFTTPDAGNTVLYAQEVRGDELIDVFVQGEEDGRVTVILAARGERTRDPESGRMSFVLHDGTRYEGVPGERRFSVIEFAEHGIPVGDGEDEEFIEAAEVKPTRELLASGDPVERAELQWRLSVPISLFVLAALAVPLSRSSPREGRYARVGTGLLIYIIYTNALSVARIWVERGQVPEWLGLWWVHGAFALAAAVLIARHAGLFARSRAYARVEPVYR